MPNEKENLGGATAEVAKEEIASNATSEAQEEAKTLDNGSEKVAPSAVNQKELDKKFAERAERAKKAERERIFSELGVTSEAELKSLKKVNLEEDRLTKLETSLENMKRENVFLKAGVDEKSADDVARYIKGGGEDFTLEAVQKALERNPQWKSGYQNTIRGVQIGSTSNDKKEVSAEERAWAKKVEAWFDNK